MLALIEVKLSLTSFVNFCHVISFFDPCFEVYSIPHGALLKKKCGQKWKTYASSLILHAKLENEGLHLFHLEASAVLEKEDSVAVRCIAV